MLRKMIYNPNKEEVVLGPAFEPDLQLLSAIVNLTDPKTIVEFGYFAGHSSKAMIEYADKDCRLYSFDNKERGFLPEDKRIKLSFKDMKDVTPKDLDNRSIDMIFFDASHEFDDSMTAFINIQKNISDSAVILVHDTGYYNKDKFDPNISLKLYKGDNVYHCPDELKFIKTLKDIYGYDVINFTCDSKIRHGIAILRKPNNLKVS